MQNTLNFEPVRSSKKCVVSCNTRREPVMPPGCPLTPPVFTTEEFCFRNKSLVKLLLWLKPIYLTPFLLFSTKSLFSETWILHPGCGVFETTPLFTLITGPSKSKIL